MALRIVWPVIPYGIAGRFFCMPTDEKSGVSMCTLRPFRGDLDDAASPKPLQQGPLECVCLTGWDGPYNRGEKEMGGRLLSLFDKKNRRKLCGTMKMKEEHAGYIDIYS